MSSGFAHGSIPTQLKVVFPDVYAIRQIRILLWDGDDRSYRYKVEISADGENWKLLTDRTGKDYRSWQILTLPREVPMKAIRVIGTRNSSNNNFHLVEIEAYCKPPSDRK